MRQRSFEARNKKLLAEESQRTECWWWLSFAGDEGFRGAVLTRERGFLTAVQKTHDLGISPGGEVRGYEIPPEIAAEAPYKLKDHADRLISKEYIDTKLGGAVKMP